MKRLKYNQLDKDLKSQAIKMAINCGFSELEVKNLYFKVETNKITALSEHNIK